MHVGLACTSHVSLWGGGGRIMALACSAAVRTHAQPTYLAGLPCRINTRDVVAASLTIGDVQHGCTAHVWV